MDAKSWMELERCDATSRRESFHHSDPGMDL
jgi:hypothetical protein